MGHNIGKNPIKAAMFLSKIDSTWELRAVIHRQLGWGKKLPDTTASGTILGFAFEVLPKNYGGKPRVFLTCGCGRKVDAGRVRQHKCDADVPIEYHMIFMDLAAERNLDKRSIQKFYMNDRSNSHTRESLSKWDLKFEGRLS